MHENDFIVSKTDLKGCITYGNRIFIEFSGYSEAELLGAPHSITRHPDMPRGVFKFLWDTLGAGKECLSYIKSMAKDGSFYWMLANVTPTYDCMGKMDGYLSVRRMPKREAVDLISDIYRRMLDEERRAGPRDACDASMKLLTGILAQKGMSHEEFVLSL
ncbi:MAG: PAS domain-containing protein [Rhodocyclaceae bacterium]|nr:PAS domain-containing protein [Rhodocyclaceae bacterium]